MNTTREEMTLRQLFTEEIMILRRLIRELQAEIEDLRRELELVSEVKAELLALRDKKGWTKWQLR